ncbi:apolipoprotein N-acyltransferase [Candidatus Magnetomorum sp. HK-1]|nr:apolipoprotein N-acyltransferase [Candidatus Magnetomorum sp. HK-1]
MHNKNILFHRVVSILEQARSNIVFFVNNNKRIDIKNIFLAIITGLMLTAAFPRTGVDIFAWFALVPLLWAVNNATSVFYLGCLAGFIHYLTLVYWLITAMHEYGHLPVFTCVPLLILLCMYLSVYIGLFCVLVKRLCSKPSQLIWAPFYWVTLEYARSLTQFAFPWELLGYSQYMKLPLIQIADITGVYGVSWIIVYFNVSVVLFLLFSTRQDWNSFHVSLKNVYILLGGTILFFVLILSYGITRIHQIDKNIQNTKEQINVTVIQGNIDQAVKWDEKFRITTLQKYINLSQTSDEDSDLVVWPETAVPIYIQQKTSLSENLRNYIKSQSASFLIGGLRYDQQANSQWSFYNSAFLINPMLSEDQTYDKAHLVPYGEYIPFQTIFPFLNKFVEGVGNFSEGKQLKPLNSEKWSYGPQICYEILFPSLSRTLVQEGADVLINITNDAWYGISSAPYQHFSMTVFRAVENKRSLARAANTGVSGYINPFGKILDSSDIFTEAKMTCKLPVLNEMTFYTRYGDVFAIFCVIVFFIALVYNVNFKKK